MGLLERFLCYSYLLALDFNSYFLNFSSRKVIMENIKGVIEVISFNDGQAIIVQNPDQPGGHQSI
jgi:hypothetical protein